MHMDVHLLEGPTDYRTLPRPERTGFAAGAWVRTPVAETDEDRVVLSVRGRGFAAIHAGHGELRMSFRQLLLAPTSAVEYLEWARDHRRWRIAGVPALDDVDREAQQRFVNLVDVLVDADVETVFTSPLGLDEFLDRASARPDAFRMSSRLRLLRTE
jgi:cell division protein ZapE